ncbi:MAG: hypothetical protein VKL39_09020 [Leptolyngbyaceae bacterium]|nr:hypothetical protein [Leptolyngbyaceae bacterium]
MKSTPDTTAMKNSGTSSLKSSTPSSPSPQPPAASVAQPKNTNAAVPITIYRELVAELQHTQQRLREMSDRNEQLAEHNQKLRHEIEQFIQTALNVRTIANDLQPDAPILPQLMVQPVQSTGSSSTGGSISSSTPLQGLSIHQPSSSPAVDGPGAVTMESLFGKSPQTESKPEWALPKPPSQVSSADGDQNAARGSLAEATAPPARKDADGDSQLDHVLAAAIARQFPKSQSTEQSPKVTTSAGSGTTPHTVSIETLDGTVTLKLPNTNQPLTTEQQHQRLTHPSSQDTKRPPLGGWWLTVIVVFIVVSAFSAGFMAMLFLQGQRSIDQSN